MRPCTIHLSPTCSSRAALNSLRLARTLRYAVSQQSSSSNKDMYKVKDTTVLASTDCCLPWVTLTPAPFQGSKHQQARQAPHRCPLAVKQACICNACMSKVASMHGTGARGQRKLNLQEHPRHAILPVRTQERPMSCRCHAASVTGYCNVTHKCESSTQCAGRFEMQTRPLSQAHVQCKLDRKHKRHAHGAQHTFASAQTTRKHAL